MKRIVLCMLLVSSFTGGRTQSLKSYFNGPVQLYYEEFGKGPALYILSGGPGEAPDHPYRRIIDSLQSFYTCILIHQRGSGKSRHIPVNEKTITIANYTRDIELLRKERGDKTITLLGVSWGGLLAMNYAAIHPRSVKKLILVSSAPPSFKVWHVLYDNQYARRSRAELDSMDLLRNIFAAKTERELDSIKRVNPRSPEVLAYKAYIAIHIRAMYYDRNKISETYFDSLFYHFNFLPISYIDQEVTETRWDITAPLKKLKTPALIIYGRQDDQGESTFYLQKESLRFSETHIIEQCGHQVLEEQPAAFFRILMDYVKRMRK